MSLGRSFHRIMARGRKLLSVDFLLTTGTGYDDFLKLYILPCLSKRKSLCSSRSLLIERFSKPNFGSIRRFRKMTGLEIEN